MVSRSLSILLATWLPMFAVMLPLGRFHTINAIVAGIAAALLSFLALSDNRARIGVAIIGAWVALSPFIFEATLIEKVLTVWWGVIVFVHMIGPFADSPRVTVVLPLKTGKPPAEDEPELARAA
jgi:hypothetical protein